jgi:hypothetical protein
LIDIKCDFATRAGGQIKTIPPDVYRDVSDLYLIARPAALTSRPATRSTQNPIEVFEDEAGASGDPPIASSSSVPMAVMVIVIALAPDHAVVELNDPAVRRVDSTGIPRHDPKPVRGEPVGAGAERLVSWGNCSENALAP